jgi:hypothetical protein
VVGGAVGGGVSDELSLAVLLSYEARFIEAIQYTENSHNSKNV